MASPVILCVDGEWPWFDGPAHLLRSIREYSPRTPFIMVPFAGCGDELDSVFENHSPNPAAFELRCFKRWFVLLNAMVKMGFTSAWAFDWDTLVFTPLDEEETKIGDVGMSIVPDCFISNIKALEKFCDFIYDLYAHKGEHFVNLVKQYESGALDNVNDMRVFELWRETIRKPAYNQYLVRDGAAFDANIAVPYYGFRVQNSSKVIRWENGIPYALTDDGGQARLKTLHCWGPHKKKMGGYLHQAIASRNA